MVQTLIYFTDEENKKLMDLSFTFKMSKTDVIRKILREYKAIIQRRLKDELK